MAGQRMIYLLMSGDYEDRSPVAAFTDRGEIDAWIGRMVLAGKLGASLEIEEVPLVVSEVPTAPETTCPSL